MRARGWIPRDQRLRRPPPVRRVERATCFTTWIGSARRGIAASAASAAAAGTIASRRLDRRWNEVIAIRGRAELQAAMAAGDDLTAAQLAHGLREMGVTAGKTFHRRFPAHRHADAAGL